MMLLDGKVDMFNPSGFVAVAEFQAVIQVEHSKEGTIVIGHKVVAASIELADLLVEVACLGGVFGFMDEAITLGPNALKESP
jgi:hypothetical protein